MIEILKIEKLCKSYGQKKILDKLDFLMAEGEITSIMGKSGAGKTTLLKIIAGIKKPDGGKIYIDGELVEDSKISKPPYDRKIGYVFQNPAIWPHMTIEENIKFPLKEDKDREYRELIEILKIEEIQKSYSEEISGGEAKRVSIARAIISNPKLLIMDEPFTNLDEEIKEDIGQMIKTIHKRKNLAILTVGHNYEDNKRISNKIFKLEKGVLNEESY